MEEGLYLRADPKLDLYYYLTLLCLANPPYFFGFFD
jgi:hypothetical protein